jgi:glc operon protein GlcG
MRFRISALALLLAAAGAAQNVPEKFVVSGKAAEKIQDFTTINLATAEAIATACEKAAVAENVGITIMILDNDGNHVFMDRMDGQTYLGIVTSEMKARTALLGRSASKNQMNAVTQDPNADIPLMQLGFFANSGGLPLVVNKQMIGVVGVGGSAPRVPVWSDEICAHKAMTEVLGPGVAPLVQDIPARRNPNPGTAPVPRFAPAGPPKQTLSAEYVVSGKDAASVLDAAQISLGAAKKIAGACRSWASGKGGMSLYVIDNEGEFVHMERSDGQVGTDVRTALLKAQTALKTRQPTSIRAAQLKNDPSGIARQNVYYNFYTASGGVPIVVDGQMIGAMGVSGVDGGADESCAVEGLKAAFGDHVTLPVYPAAQGGR